MEHRTQNSEPETPALPVLPSGAQVPEWVMVARTGRWQGHPLGPEIVTAEHLRGACDYFARHYGAHGADLAVDYHHASVLAAEGRVERAPAAGWIKDMELRSDGAELWGRALWTAEAAAAIARREFRYLSPVLRFAVPDRVTGAPVPMIVHSVALTNTPFLTELQALNENPVGATAGPPSRGLHSAALRRVGDLPSRACPGPVQSPCPTDNPRTVLVNEGGDTVPVLAQMAAVLGKPQEELLCALGIESADDKQVAERILAQAARLREQESRQAAGPLVANALGLPENSDAQAVRDAVLALRAAAPALASLRQRLGLADAAGPDAVLNAVDALCEERDGREATQLVDAAIQAGRVPPSQRAFFLACARQDPAAARECLNSLPPLMTPVPPVGARHAPAARDLTDAERSVCRQLALSAEAFLAAVS